MADLKTLLQQGGGPIAGIVAKRAVRKTVFERPRGSCPQLAGPCAMSYSTGLDKLLNNFEDPKKYSRKKDRSNDFLNREGFLFCILTFTFCVFIATLSAIWLKYEDEANLAGDLPLYAGFRDVNIMIFFGFSFLMCVLKKNAYNAIGYTFLMASISCLWSLILEAFFTKMLHGHDFFDRYPVGVNTLLNSLFCAAAVLITLGAVLGKITPVQALLVAFIEPIFYWLNYYLGSMKLEAVDIGGGMFIHTFGCYFGLSMSFFVTYSTSVSDGPASNDLAESYNSNIFSFAGTMFLWIMWPSFNAVLAEPGTIFELRAYTNTFLALIGATIGALMTSRIPSVVGMSKHRWKWHPVHLQNATLAGGVIMGVAANLDIHVATAMSMGMFSGILSTLGYVYGTPLLEKFLRVQDVAGINNLHGMPGIVGAILGVIVLTEEHDGPYFRGGDEQWWRNLVALGITLALSIVGGAIGGLAIWAIRFVFGPMFPEDFYNDKPFWDVPTNYAAVGFKPEGIADTSDDDDDDDSSDDYHGVGLSDDEKRIN